MSKKVSVFGKGIPVFVIVILGMALVSAALVPYLSGMVTGTVEVESPLDLKVGDTTSWSVVAKDAFKEIEKNFVLVNNADTEVYAIVETNITGIDDNGAKVWFSGSNVGEEFEYFWIGIHDLSDGTEGCTRTPGGASDDGYCYWDASIDTHYTGVDSGVYYVQMGDGTTPIGADETMYGRMKLKFKINVAPATYTFETQALVPEKAKDLTSI